MHVSKSNINALIISFCVFNTVEGIAVCIDRFIYNEYRVTLQMLMIYKHQTLEENRV